MYSRPPRRDCDDFLCWSLLIGRTSYAYAWRNTVWDPTKGFPGEGPPSHSDEWHTGWSSDYLPERDHPFVTHAAAVLSGTSLGRGQLAQLRQHTPLDEMASILTSVAMSGNSSRPVAARFQSRPHNVARLVQDPLSIATIAAHRGVTYRFSQRPCQSRRPTPLRVSNTEGEAITREIQRLFHDCHAIERAPPHDADKGLLRTETFPFELMRAPAFCMREAPVPVFDTRCQIAQYDHRQLATQARRRNQSLPFRDFESTVFTVPKKDGGHRLCTDFRPLNRFAERSHFQMEGVQQVAELIQPGDFGLLVDLKDCYLTLGLHPSQRKYCRFRCPSTGTRYQWRTVSFGMSEAPRICTKILRPLIGILKSLGIRCLIYIDDLLVIDQCPLRAARAMGLAMQLLQKEVGLQLKMEKGLLQPAQTFACLGIIWNTSSMTCSIPAKRVKALQHTASRLLKMSSLRDGRPQPIPTRDMARFTGQVISTCRAIRPARRRLNHIQHDFARGLKRGGWRGWTILSTRAREALRWWTSEELWRANGDDIVPPIKPIQISLRTDAATHNAGYGGVMRIGDKEFRTRGHLTDSERDERFINEFEFSGCRNSLWSLLPVAIPDRSQWHRVHVSIELDNVTAIRYGRTAIGRSIKMSAKGVQFFDEVENAGISISFRHVAGILNVTADRLSRQRTTHADWRLHPSLANGACHVLGIRPNVDLFASAQNAQCTKFFSYNYDFRAIGADAFLHDWGGLGDVYAYPPPILMSRVLQKIRTDDCHRAIVIAPVWTFQAWFPSLMQMLCAPPLLLPNRQWIVSDPTGLQCWPMRWPLMAAPVSGSITDAFASRRHYCITSGSRWKAHVISDMGSISDDGTDDTPIPDILRRAVIQSFYETI